MMKEEAKALEYGDHVWHSGRLGKVIAHIADWLIILWSDGTTSEGSDMATWMIDRA